MIHVSVSHDDNDDRVATTYKAPCLPGRFQPLKMGCFYGEKRKRQGRLWMGVGHLSHYAYKELCIRCMRHVTFMSHTWMWHITHAWHLIWHITHMRELLLVYRWDMSHVWARHERVNTTSRRASRKLDLSQCPAHVWCICAYKYVYVCICVRICNMCIRIICIWTPYGAGLPGS